MHSAWGAVDLALSRGTNGRWSSSGPFHSSLLTSTHVLIGRGLFSLLSG